MDLEQIKYHTCPVDQEEGILLANIDETLAATDSDGELQYYCMAGHHTFSVDEDDVDSWGNRR